SQPTPEVYWSRERIPSPENGRFSVLSVTTPKNSHLESAAWTMLVQAATASRVNASTITLTKLIMTTDLPRHLSVSRISWISRTRFGFVCRRLPAYLASLIRILISHHSLSFVVVQSNPFRADGVKPLSHE